MIEIRGLSKSFGRHQVLGDVSLTLRRGVFTGLAGPNGCGKTTLIKCLLGLVVPTRGQLFIDGKPIDQRGGFRRELGYMPQLANFPTNLNSSELFTMLEDLRGVSARHRNELCDYFGVTASLNQPFGQLSGGTKQKIAAVAAFMFDAPIVILDEPTAGLDPLSSLKLKDLLRRKTSDGKTILMVSHLMSEIEQLAQELIFLDEGSVVFHGRTDLIKSRTHELSLERAVTRLFAGEVVQ